MSKEFKEICKELNDIYNMKNSDYGDSFSKLYNEFGILSAVIRLSDKVERLKTLVKEDNIRKVDDESIDDTLKDLAGYAIMTLMERNGDNESDSSDDLLEGDPRLRTDLELEE